MSSRARHVFVVPPMDGAITGGNRYNEGLTSALRRRSDLDVDIVVGVAAAEAELRSGAPGTTWIDSLYLDEWPRLAAARQAVHQAVHQATRPLGLLAHYLPALVEHGGIPPLEALSAVERAALASADVFLAPSTTMAEALRVLGAGERPVIVVEPGLDPEIVRARAAALAPPAGAPCRAVLVANLVPGKGILPFLDALAAALDVALAAALDHALAAALDDSPLTIEIVGRFEADPAYADACRARVAGAPALARTVRLVGELPHAEMLARLASSDVFVSASRMESYGLALAEARALGVPIVARGGGHVAAHVEPLAGGRLCADDASLARECVRLAQDPAERAARRRAARTAAPRPRTWDEAATEFARVVAAWHGPSGEGA